MSRLTARFEELRNEGDGALVAFVVAGHPDVERSSRILLAIADAGADVIDDELSAFAKFLESCIV